MAQVYARVMVIFLGVTLLGSSFTAFANPVFAAAPGTFIDNFVTAGSGGLNDPYDLLFAPDGNLYVSSYQTDEVLRYDGITGAFIDAFVTAGSGGLNGPTGVSFAPDGNLYVSSYKNDKVKRYEGPFGVEEPPVVVEPPVVEVDEKKVSVCHIPPGNPAGAHVIRISESALGAHLGHDDILGNHCPGDEDAQDELRKKMTKEKNTKKTEFKKKHKDLKKY